MKIILTTGGTGGHIYPALALAKSLKKDNDENEILFIGTTNHMEKDIIEKSDFDFYGFKLNSGTKGKVDKLLQYFRLLFATLKIYFKFLFDRPDLVMGFGAYISAPALLAAKFLNIDILLHEQNSSMGKVNKMMFKSAKDVIVCYESILEDYDDKKVKLLGNPRASEVKDIEEDKEIFEQFNFSKNKKTILMVMGSQGSESINDTMFDLLPQFTKEDYQVIYVTGSKHHHLFEKDESQTNVVVLPYVDQAQMLANCDLVIARGGATTAAEICALGVPSIIVPSPYVANNHQYTNAKQLAQKDASVIIREKDLNSKILFDSISSIIYDDQKLESMSKAAKSLAKENASKDIVNLINEYRNEE